MVDVIDRCVPGLAALTAIAIATVAVGTPTRGVAQDFFESHRDFVIDKPCDAYRSFKRRTDPTPVEVGKSYPGRGVNRAGDPSHVFIRMGRENRWVSLACGHYAYGRQPGADPATGRDGGAGPRAPSNGNVGVDSAAAASCAPFFDAIDNPVKIGFGGTVDITPPPPALDAFDRAINATCGPVGKVVSQHEFKAMMLAHPEVLRRVMAFTRGKVFADHPALDDAERYLEELTRAWFAIHAFDHIMCGEPGSGRNTIGGLHFRGRYVQLQESGEACRMTNYRQNEVVPGVLYTMGVLMRTPDGRMARHATKGFGLTLSGEDLMKVVTRAFSDNPTDKTESTACMLPVRDDGVAFTAVFVRRAAGIRTFYPDGTPSKRDPACRAAIDLQAGG